jgi:hypothetical protein
MAKTVWDGFGRRLGSVATLPDGKQKVYDPHQRTHRMMTSRSKCRPANRSFMPLTLLTFGPFHPNYQCIPLSLAICTRAS